MLNFCMDRTHREKERRQRLVDCLNHRYQTIENLMRNPVENKRYKKILLFALFNFKTNEKDMLCLI